MKPTRLFIMRHGTTQESKQGIITGQRDVPLAEDAYTHLSPSLEALIKKGPKRIFCSDLLRAKQTANIVAEHFGLPAPLLEPRLRERCWGIWQGQPRNTNPSLSDDEAPEGGESLNTLKQRVFCAVDEIIQQHGTDSLVITHAGPIREIAKHWNFDTTEIQPGQWFVAEPPSTQMSRDVGSGSTSAEITVFRVEADVIAQGSFSGKVVYVQHAQDLSRVTEQSLVLLYRCTKSIAIEAMNHCKAAINLTRALTAHLTYGRISNAPYAISRLWPDGLPEEGQQINAIVQTGPIKKRMTPFLPDIQPIQSTQAETIGGKAAGLLLLETFHFFVPTFFILSSHILESWKKTGDFFQECSRWVQSKQQQLSGKQWAVRSSADVEDNEKDPMSGSFQTLLHQTLAQIPQAIHSVSESTQNAEIQQRIQSGRLLQPPQMSVIIQEMVEPFLGGTLFLPAPQSSGDFLLEALVCTNAEALMDGQTQADVTARFNAYAKLLSLEITQRWNIHKDKITQFCEEVAQQGFDIYKKTGRGDLEFAVTHDGKIHWLQARILPPSVEIVDRVTFHPTAKAYYKLLAFCVAEANQTPPVFFRCADLPDGRFGYSVGIRQRDVAFHQMIRDDLSHLQRVTAHGWEIEHRMSSLTAQIHATSHEELFACLILHGAVQLPFSIPMKEIHMERFQSVPADGESDIGLLEETLESLNIKMNNTNSVDSIIRQLRMPQKTFSNIEARKRKIAFLQSLHHADHTTQILERMIPELRDIPDLSKDSLQRYKEEAFQEIFLHDVSSSNEDLLQKEQIQLQKETLKIQKEIYEREYFLQKSKEVLDPNDFQTLRIWADYLQMKAETNETHCLYRGQCFLHFARNHFILSSEQIDAEIQKRIT